MLLGDLAHRGGAQHEPAPGPVGAPHAGPHVLWLVRGKNAVPAFAQLCLIVRVDRRQPAVTHSPLQAHAGVLAPCPVDEIDASVG